MNRLRAVLALLLIAPTPTLCAQMLAAPDASGSAASPRRKAKSPAASAADPGAAPGAPATVPPVTAPGNPAPTQVALPSFSGPSSPAAPAAPFGAPMCGGPEKQELDKITALNMIETQKSQQKLRAVNEERDESSARYNALYEKQKLELAPLEFELKKLQLQSNLDEERFKKELTALRQQRDKLRLDNEIARERLAAEQAKADADKLKMDVALRDLDFQSRKLRMDTELIEHKTVALKTDLDLRTKKEEWKKQANRDPEYAPEPFSDGVLTVSDRRITLDGPIVFGTADYVTERIHYFNNKDEKAPIFIVIDRSPGGSVMEGERILKAMRESKAPVHVVVKSFAASMAAIIATLAPHSYAYPNAVILHHQMLSMSWGNLTQQKEQLDIFKQWYQRIMQPVAGKMGMSLEELTKQMYKHNSDGNWQEFGDEAARLKWADRVVHEIRETGIVKEPDGKPVEPPRFFFGLKEETDAQGQRFVRLPRLQPYDAYWIDNQDNYYR